MGASATHASREHVSSAEPARRAPTLARAGAGPAHALDLQRTIGNAAVARMAKSDRQALHRACCPSCAAGRSCGSHGPDELEALKHKH